MNRAWAATLSNIWHSTNWPMWLAIIAAVLIVVGLVIAVVRSEGSLARNVVIFVVVMAIGIATIIVMTRGPSMPSQTVSVAPSTPSIPSAPDRRPAATATGFSVQAPPPLAASLPALACLDGIAGESVESACEKALFATADSTAAAVSYTAAQITRLASFGTAGAADTIMTPDLRASQNDRARSLRSGRTGSDDARRLHVDSVCFFSSLTTTAQIGGNMNERLYDGLVGRYSPFWNAPAASSAASNASVPAIGAPGTPAGKPVSGDFPSASSIPPVNIMTPEPAAQGAQSAPRQPDANAASARAAAPAAPKKSSAQKSRAQAPTSLAPAQAADDN